VAEGEGGELLPYKLIFDSSPDIITVFDQEGRILFNSRASERIHGYKRDDLIGKNTVDYIHPEDRERVNVVMADLIAHPGEPKSVRYRYKNADGSWIWMEATGVSRFDEPGLRGLIAISRDVSATVAAEELLETTLSEKEDLVREIQHRVKNSIAMISSFLSLEEGRAAEESLKTVLENLRFRIDSVANLYRLLFASGDPSRVNLNSYLERLVLDLVQTFDCPEVATNIAVEGLVIDTKSAGPLGILCTELVSNALRHGFGGGRRGTLSVSLARSGDALVLAVADDGKGLCAGFDLEGDTGLGLQLSRMLAMQLKGRLVAERPEKGGARFVFSMPYQAEA
jgi:PAS domain S-box-containing protein